MHLSRLFLIVALLATACKSQVPLSYDYTPTLLHLNKYKQHDSIGFNLVSELPKLLYAKILSEDIALWDSPQKKVKIDKNSFNETQKQAKYPFVEGTDLFIHQMWRIYKHNFSAGTLGFTFTGETKEGRKINYGFIDAADVMVLMKDRNIPSNANGTHYLSFWDAVNCMQYDFNIVQFGDENFKTNPKLSFRLRHQAIKSKRIHRDFIKLPTDKEIEYRVVPPELSSNKENNALYKAFEQFANENKQTILNAGGSAFLDPWSARPWAIDNIIVTEKWSKRNKYPFQAVLTVQLFIRGGSVILDKTSLDELNMMVKLQGYEEFLSGKSFNFTLQRINSQEISAQESEKYYTALWRADWNKINK